MSIRNSFLAILADDPSHGYGLKSRFERSTARAWPLNVGQIYTTLARMERDGLVESAGGGDRSRQIWRLTAEGRSALCEWYREPVVDDPPPRDELALKVLLAVAAEDVDVSKVLQTQRKATVQRLQEYTRCKRAADPDEELAWILLLDALILKCEAEVRWLDHCEATLAEKRR